MAKKRIGVTGCEGMLGWHFRCRLLSYPENEVSLANRQTFQSATLMDEFVRSCDVIVHLAGMNRGDDDEIEQANPQIAQMLIDAMEREGVTPHVLYSSSTHIERDTPYGRSKRRAGELLEQWSERCDSAFANFVLPHVFGEMGKPFYNSVVSTFSYLVARGEAPAIDQDGALELVHAQECALQMLDAIEHGTTGRIRVEGKPMRVSEMLERLQSMAELYMGGVLPDVRDEFDLALFNTLRSYLYEHHYPVGLTLHADNRGTLFEAVKSHHGGQAFVSSTRPGITRGDHFHYSKIERFLVVQGSAVIRLRRLLDDTVREFHVSGDEPVYIDMPTLHTHNITNIGETDVLTLFWSDQIFDPEKPDTLHEPV